MKYATALILAAVLAFTAGVVGRAQAPESIWLAAKATSYAAGDTVIVTVNGQSATQIQGFTFQIRYDPACLKAVNTASPISGMNGLPLPQKPGIVGASFASTVPQTANGVLAEVRFLGLTACQTNLVLESAALAIRSENGFAAPLKGTTVGNSSLAVQIGPGTGAAKPTEPMVGTPMALAPELPAGPDRLRWGLLIVLVVFLGAGVLLAISRRSRA
jgi:cohesin domain-containing protein